MIFHILFFLVDVNVSFGVERGSCLRTGHFNITVKGKGLQGHEFATHYVDSPLDCTIHCVSNPRCESFNLQLDEHQPRVCELNSKKASDDELVDRPGFMHYGWSPQNGVTSSCASSPCQNGGHCIDKCRHSFECICEPGFIGDTCGFDAGNFSLIFPARSTLYFAIYNGLTDVSAFTLCLLLKFTQQEIATLFSYITPNENQVLALKYIGEGTSEFIFRGTASKWYSAPLNDGAWHHVCVTWESVNSKVNFFVDGFRRDSDDVDAVNYIIRGGGNLIVGQSQLIYNDALESNQSFCGRMTNINMWNSVLEDSKIVELSETYTNEQGNVMTWTTFFQKDIRLRLWPVIPSGCMALQRRVLFSDERQNESYVTTTISNPLSELTVGFWFKFKTFRTYFFSYKVDHFGDNVFQLNIERGSIVMATINGLTRSFQIIARADGRWNHVVLTWENKNGTCRFYFNGAVFLDVSGFQVNEVVPAAGQLYIGHKVLSDGTLVVKDAAFLGSLSAFNIWDRAFDGYVVVAMSRGDGLESGNVFAWNDLDFIPGNRWTLSVNAPLKSRTLDSPSDFQLSFPAASVNNWAKFKSSVDNFRYFTASLWINPSKTTGAIFHYATENYTNAYALYMYPKYVTVAVNGSWRNTTEVPFTYGDGDWHYLGIDWSNRRGEWRVYYNGQMVFQDDGFSTDETIEGGGMFVLGQKMTSFGGVFDPSLSYVGDMSHLNIWGNRLDPLYHVTMMRGCSLIRGSRVPWIRSKFEEYGDVKKKSRAPCTIPDYALSKKRDQWCETNLASDTWPAECLVEGKPKALFDSNSTGFGRKWRCYLPSALNLTENGIYKYDQEIGSKCVQTRHLELLEILD